MTVIDPAAGTPDADLRDREARLRAVFESIDEGYCVCDMIVDADGVAVDYRFLEVNPTFESMTGLADAVGRTALELVPDLERHWVETYARVGLGGETLRFQQGSEAMGRWFEVFAVPVPPAGRFALVFRDQTKQHQAELARVESEERFRAMTDELPMLVWNHDVEDRFVWANKTVCDFLAVTRDEVLGGARRFESHPDDEQLVPAVRAARHARTRYRGQMRIRRSDGEWRWIEAWGRPRFDGAGRYLGYVGAALDVTDRVEGEAATKRSAVFLRRLIDNLFAFVGVLTPDGTLIEANRAPLDAAGITAEDVLGRKFWDARWWTVDEATQDRLRDAVARAAAGETVRYDVQVRGTGDELIWIDFQLAPLRDDHGNVTHLVPSGHVINERIETERRLADALDAERRTRERVELLQRNATQLAGAITVDELARVLLDELRTSLGLQYTALNVLHGDQLEVIAPSGMPEVAVDRYQHVRVDAELPGPIAIRTNAPVIVMGYERIHERFPDIVDDANGLPRIETLATFPLRAASGSAIGALFLATPEPGWLDVTTVELLTSIAGQTGLALERAELHRQVLEAHQAEHAIAVQLQRAWLPDRLAEHPAIRIAARYVAAHDLMAVGGDWYDTFAWPDGHIGVTVGDVVGHDLAAATTMGRLRIGVNALMSRCEPDPAAVLDAYDDYGRGLGPAFATAASIVLDGETGELTFATAGHPAPIVLLPDGGARWLTTDVAPPLGVPNEQGHRKSSIALLPGSTVILYSDGLIERRRVPLDDGFDRLSASARRHVGLDVDSLADAILTDLTGEGEIGDDVIVVCVRWCPPGADPC